MQVESINEALRSLMRLNGFSAAAVIAEESGRLLGCMGDDTTSIRESAERIAEMARAQANVVEQLGLSGSPDDLIIQLKDHYHLSRCVPEEGEAGSERLVLHLVLDRHRANLAMARLRFAEAARAIGV